MSLVYVPNGSIRYYECQSTDIVDNKVTGASYVGANLFVTDTQTWYTVLPDLTLTKLVYNVSTADGTSVTVQSPLRQVTSVYTRPADTTAYAAGDVVGESPAAVKEITNCARVAGAGGIIESIYVLDSANQSTKLSLPEVWLFTVAPAAVADNAAFAPSDAELLNLVGVIQLDNVFVGNSGSGAAGNCIYTTSSPIHQGFDCATASSSLYWVFVTRNAYTPIASESFTLSMRIQD